MMIGNCYCDAMKSKAWCIVVCLMVFALPASMATEFGPVLTLDKSPNWRGQPRGSTTGLTADVNGDGYSDLISIQNTGEHVIYFNTGSGLAPNPAWRIDCEANTVTYSVAVADLQADGYPELILFKDNQTHSIPSCSLYVNTNGIPETVPTWHSQIHFSYRGDVGDVDGDNIPDLYVAVYNDADVLYRGQPTGSFEDVPMWTSGDVVSSADAELIDMDNDGDLDAAICAMGDSPLRIYTNTDGTLSLLPTSEISSDIKPVMITGADADNDGFPEVAIGAWTSPSVVFWNVGGMLETDPRWSALPNESLLDKYHWSYVEWADINGDGYPEIAMGSRWWGSNGEGGDSLRVFTNTGDTLTESASWVSNTQRSIYELGFADFTGDGNPDMWVAAGDAPEIYQNSLSNWDGLGVSLWMPARQFAPGDSFSIKLNINNPGEPLPQTPVFVILELAGSLWCAPAWTDLSTGADYFVLDVPTGPSQLQVLYPFPWPDVQGSMNGLCVYAAMTDSGMTGIRGNLDLWYFGYHP